MLMSGRINSWESAEPLPEIHDFWHNILRASALDYQQISQKELTKCLTEDQKAAAKFIGVAELMKYPVRSMAYRMTLMGGYISLRVMNKGAMASKQATVLGTSGGLTTNFPKSVTHTVIHFF